MTKKISCFFITFVFCILFILLMINNNSARNSLVTSWIGQYTFYEFAPPNQNMNYVINVYEDDGLYAYITIDGFHTLKRLKTKVWSRENEIMFIFYQYYTDVEGNNTLNESYNEGDILLKLKKDKGILITEWGSIIPMLSENDYPGQYFEIK